MSSLLQLIRFLMRASREHESSRFIVLLLIGAGIVAGLASTGLLALINVALGPDDGESAPLISWGFLALAIVLPLSRFASQSLLVRLAEKITRNLRLSLSHKILTTPLHVLEKMGPPKLLATLTGDIVALTNALTILPVFFLQLAVAVSCLAYMGWLSWQLFLFVLLCIICGITVYQIPVSRALRHYRKSREGMDQLLTGFRGLTEGTKELKVHRTRREAFFAEVLEPTVNLLRRHNVTGGTIYALSNSWGQVLFFVVIGMLLFVLPQYSQFNDLVLRGYTLAILYLLTPLDVILNSIPELGRAVVSAGKIERLGLSLEEKATTKAAKALPAAESGWQRLTMKSVTHSYYREDKDESFTLGPIDLEINSGELIFIIGGNGSGKTTLAKMIIGLYTPEEGEILLDGGAVVDENRDAYRQLFSVVFSDFFLFETLLGIDTKNIDESARSYIDRLHLKKKVQVENGRLSTLDLSQGQRKRLALLTAYLEDREIYLFDEWAADQDPQFKEVFYHQILRELKQRNKTVVVISHDDRYFHIADRIVKLDYGKVIDDFKDEVQPPYAMERGA